MSHTCIADKIGVSFTAVHNLHAAAHTLPNRSKQSQIQVEQWLVGSAVARINQVEWGRGGGATFTFVFDHEVFVEWQVHSVHAKLPSLCALWSAGARVVPDQVCGYQRATWLMHKHHLQKWLLF